MVYEKVRISIESRAHRTICNTKNYRKIDFEMIKDIYGSKLVAFCEGEELIGFYHNNESSIEKSIIFTSLGIRVFSENLWTLIKYDEIRSAKTKLSIEDTSVSNVNEVFLHLKDGSSYILPVRGKDGRYKDVFEFHRFFMRVIDDCNNK